MQENDKLHVKRILIAIDARGCNRVTLHHVATLASDMQADIFGLYIEDTNLIHAAQLPHTKEVSLRTAQLRELSSDTINVSLRDFGNEMKILLEEQAKLTQTRTSFKTTRGLRIPTILEESKNANFIIIPASASWSFNHRDQQAIEQLPFVIFYDSSHQGQTILRRGGRWSAELIDGAVSVRADVP